MDELFAKADQAIELLTPRERECLRLVDQHLTSKEIARQLGISKYTVDTHLDNARQRLGVDTRYDAARLVAAYDRDGPIPTASGGEPIRIGMIDDLPPHPSTQEGADERAQTARAKNDDGSGFAVPHAGFSGGDGSRDAFPVHHLGSAGTATVRIGGDVGPAGFGPDLGVGHPQTGQIQDAGSGASRGALYRLGPHGRDLSPRIGGGRNDLNLLQRLAYILAIVIGSCIAFGSVLAGLHALKDLV
jgi:DNA-binding CsgD family transcriptional regulator